MANDIVLKYIQEQIQNQVGGTTENSMQLSIDGFNKLDMIQNEDTFVNTETNKFSFSQRSIIKSATKNGRMLKLNKPEDKTMGSYIELMYGDMSLSNQSRV